MLALLEMLREKDEQIARLQEDRVRLSGQVGYLQAQVGDRDARLKLLEAATIESAAPRLLRAAAGSESVSSSQSLGVSGGDAATSASSVNSPTAGPVPATRESASTVVSLEADRSVALPEAGPDRAHATPDEDGSGSGGAGPAATAGKASGSRVVPLTPESKVDLDLPVAGVVPLVAPRKSHAAAAAPAATSAQTARPSVVSFPDGDGAASGPPTAGPAGASPQVGVKTPSAVSASVGPKPPTTRPAQSPRSADVQRRQDGASSAPRRESLQTQAIARLQRLRRYFQRDR